MVLDLYVCGCSRFFLVNFSGNKVSTMQIPIHKYSILATMGIQQARQQPKQDDFTI